MAVLGVTPLLLGCWGVCVSVPLDGQEPDSLTPTILFPDLPTLLHGPNKWRPVNILVVAQTQATFECSSVAEQTDELCWVHSVGTLSSYEHTVIHRHR